MNKKIKLKLQYIRILGMVSFISSNSYQDDFRNIT